MKNAMKKFVVLLTAMVMVFAMSATAFADTTTKTVGVTDHTFAAYQIFSGTQAADGGALGNVEWGTGVNSAALLTALKADTTIGADFTSCTTAADVATVVTGYATNSDQAKAFARLVDANKSAATTAITDNTISTPGYYLIVDTTNVSGQTDAKNLSLLAVSSTVTITSKTSVPTVVKKVDDKNDSNTDEDAVNWQDSADYDIGDTIPYQITATMGDLSNFKTYYVQFNDTMTHLTYVADSVKVTVDGADKTTAFTTTWNADSKTLTVVCNDVKAAAVGATSNSVIVVTYNATLDSNANIGSKGNPNTVNLEFSNNPNNSGDGTKRPDDTGKTPDDKNIVFTYKVDANKITADKKALAGAAFELQKKNADGSWSVVSIQNATKGTDGTYTITDATATSFEWKGIDDGVYKIVEVVTPAGYNTIADQEFTVAATHDTEADEPELKTLTGTPATGSVITLAADVDAGSLTTDIVNQAGATLPTTGGMGTTIFYVVGAIMVVVAGVLLVTRRRMAR